MRNEIYVLTLKSGKVKTRVQIGCMDMAFDMLAYADVCDMFYSFKRVNLDLLPKRSPAEVMRAENFIALSREYAVKFIH